MPLYSVPCRGDFHLARHVRAISEHHADGPAEPGALDDPGPAAGGGGPDAVQRQRLLERADGRVQPVEEPQQHEHVHYDVPGKASAS